VESGVVFVMLKIEMGSAYGYFSKGEVRQQMKGNCISKKGDFCENTRIRQKMLKPTPCLTTRTEKAIMRLDYVSVEHEKGWLCNVSDLHDAIVSHPCMTAEEPRGVAFW